MEQDIWEVIKAIVQWLVLPLVMTVAFFSRKYMQRIELVEKRINEMEIRMALVENNLTHIRNEVEEIKKGVDKILDRI